MSKLRSVRTHKQAATEAQVTDACHQSINRLRKDEPAAATSLQSSSGHAFHAATLHAIALHAIALHASTTISVKPLLGRYTAAKYTNNQRQP